MRDTRVKKIIRTGWSHPERVEGWVTSQLQTEYFDPRGRKAWKAALRRAVAGIPARRERRALDLGTGPGTIAQFWAELGFATTGLDFSPPMLEAGRRLAAERGLAIDFVEGDAEAPEFRPSSFDVISTRFLLFTLPHPGYAVRRWVELLRPDGALVCVGHDHPQNPENRGHHKSRKKRRWRLAKPELHREALANLPFKNHTSGELTVVLEAAGLREIRRVDMGAVVAAREEIRERSVEFRSVQSRPFILVGRK